MTVRAHAVTATGERILGAAVAVSWQRPRTTFRWRTWRVAPVCRCARDDDLEVGILEAMADARRVDMDWEAYHRLARRACFVCELLAGNPEYPHHVVHRDGVAVAFLNRFPVWPGHLLVAPVTHVEDVVAVDRAEYLAVQRVTHAAGQALVAEVETERLYVLSLGSRLGNRHVHWHLVPLPPGVPYEQQQIAALAPERGYLDIADQEQADLARRLRTRLDLAADG